MDTKKQTAVEWLVDNLTSHYPHIKELKLTIGLAKDMEKEQIVSAQMDMFNHINQNKFGVDYLNKRDAAEEYAEQYYTQTYERNRDNQTL